MCGIIGVINPKNKTELPYEELINIYQDQYTRGKEGFGLVAVDKEGKINVKRATTEAKMMLDAISLAETPIIFLHHRNPTSSANKLSQTHPIVVSNNSLQSDYLVMHNGIIYDRDKLIEEHIKAGFQYTTAYQGQHAVLCNDSEILAIEMALILEGKITKPRVAGSAAFIILQVNKTSQKLERVYFYRNNSNPLRLSVNREVIRLASENKGEEIKADTLYSFNLQSYEINKKPFVLPTSNAVTTYAENEYWDKYPRTHYGQTSWNYREKEIGFKDKVSDLADELDFSTDEDVEELCEKALDDIMIEVENAITHLNNLEDVNSAITNKTAKTSSAVIKDIMEQLYKQVRSEFIIKLKNKLKQEKEETKNQTIERRLNHVSHQGTNPQPALSAV